MNYWKISGGIDSPREDDGSPGHLPYTRQISISGDIAEERRHAVLSENQQKDMQF